MTDAGRSTHPAIERAYALAEDSHRDASRWANLGDLLTTLAEERAVELAAVEKADWAFAMNSVVERDAQRIADMLERIGEALQ